MTAPIDPVCRLVRQAREKAGFSQRELARRMGVGVSSVSSIEAGRIPRRESLRRLLEHLPALSLQDVLGVRRTLPVASSLSVWRAAWVDAVVRAEKVDARESHGKLVLRVTAASAALECRETAMLTAARAICVGSPAFIRRLSVDDLTAEMREESTLHRFSLRGPRVDYTCERATGAAHEFTVTYPIRTLVLHCPVVTARDRPQLDIVTTASTSERERNLGRYLHPEGLDFRRVGAQWRVVVPQPLVGLRYTLTTTSADAEGVTSRPLPRNRLGDARGRESFRAVARRAGLDHETISDAEAGADCRMSTLRSLLEALPAAQGHELIGLVEQERPDSWEYYRQLFGFSADEVTKTIDVAPEGTRTTKIATRGLLPVSKEADLIVLRVGRDRAVLDQTPANLTRVSGPDDRMRILHLTGTAGTNLHQLQVRTDRAIGGARFALTYTDAGRYTLHTGELPARGEPARRAGASLPVRYPQRVARLVVRFPAGYAPLDIQGHAWPSPIVADEKLMMDESLRALPVRLVSRRGRLAVHLEVERPSVGFHYSISWRIPT